MYFPHQNSTATSDYRKLFQDCSPTTLRWCLSPAGWFLTLLGWVKRPTLKNLPGCGTQLFILLHWKDCQMKIGLDTTESPGSSQGHFWASFSLAQTSLRSPSPTPCSKQDLLKISAQHVISWVLNQLQIPHPCFTTSCKRSFFLLLKESIFKSMSMSPCWWCY